jgi:glycosyltransferase involved in cell wall biosynthesis
VPVLLDFESHARRLVEEAGCGIAFAPEDDAGLVAGIERPAADPDAARRMGENCRSYVLERDDRRELARRYLAVLQRVRSEHGRR